MSDSDLPHVEVYTDGGCDPNPGPGGWGAVLRFGDREWVLSGNDPKTTNNRMELQAATAALATLKETLGRCHVELYTDSEYLRRGITEWIAGWERNGWRTADKQPVKNQDLWQRLQQLAQAHNVRWHWLKGHTGHPLNERADRLATEARQALQRGPKTPTRQQTPPDGRPAVEMCVKASSRGAQGPGGWAAVLRMGNHVKSLSGGESETTANAMLIRAATEGLRALTRPCRVLLYSDADYLIKGATEWIVRWQARNWRTRDGKPVANRAEWEALLDATKGHRVTWLSARGDLAPDDLAQAGVLAAEAARAVLEEE
jgi:ribonuclease HI